MVLIISWESVHFSSTKGQCLFKSKKIPLLVLTFGGFHRFSIQLNDWDKMQDLIDFFEFTTCWKWWFPFIFGSFARVREQKTPTLSASLSPSNSLSTFCSAMSLDRSCSSILFSNVILSVLKASARLINFSWKANIKWCNTVAALFHIHLKSLVNWHVWREYFYVIRYRTICEPFVPPFIFLIIPIHLIKLHGTEV